MKAPNASDVVVQIFAKHPDLALPLTRCSDCDQEDVRKLIEASPDALFPRARNAPAALSGLLLILGCWEESHRISQDIASSDGSYWHGIAHRIEPDASNAAYWFRRVGQHPVFPDLRQAASDILKGRETNWKLGPRWDPFVFIEWCEAARQNPGSAPETLALQIQQAEWRLLFDWCSMAQS